MSLNYTHSNLNFNSHTQSLPSSQKFPWNSLPQDIRHTILRHLPLPQLLHPPTQTVFIEDAPRLIDLRIRRLQPLWKAWLDSPLYVRNRPDYRTRTARQNTTPAEFVQLERLVLGSSRFSGCLTSAIAEFETLKILHLDQNDLVDLPAELIFCRQLKLLDCAANMFSRVPDVVLKMRSLQYVVFSHNPRLRELPPKLSGLDGLVAVSFYMCALERLPMEFIEKVVRTPRFSLNVAANNFPKLYLIHVCEQWPAFKSRLTHVMVDAVGRTLRVV